MEAILFIVAYIIVIVAILATGPKNGGQKKKLTGRGGDFAA